MGKKEEFLSRIDRLNPDQQLLLADTIHYGAWGDTSMDFSGPKGLETDYAFGYCTNDAKKGGHFEGRKLGSMFRAMYNKLCPLNGKGAIFAHVSNWWGDGRGDMLFIRSGYYEIVEDWAYDLKKELENNK